MGRDEKLIEKLLSIPSDFNWDEIVKVLSIFGFAERKTGKTGGSRRKFVNERNRVISLHKPHPSNIVKRYALKQVIDVLVNEGKISEK